MPLSLHGVTKRFGPTVALDEASIDVRDGTVHALLGENGAGKTTLMRIAFGLLEPDAGTVRVGERGIAPRSPADAIAAGVGMVHQHFTLVSAMTVAENVALGGRGRLDRRAMRERVRAIGHDTGLVLDPDARVESLPVGAQQRLEIVKALARGARTLIMDEPTAVLSPRQSAELLDWLRGFAGGGGSVVLITHKLADALRVADEVTVLRRGRTVATGLAAGMTADSLGSAMLGDAATVPGDAGRIAGGAGTTARDTGSPVMQARDVSVRDERGVERIHGASFTLQGGEIVGVAGVEGSGTHELLRVLAGRLEPTSGTLERPEDVGFVPEDRQLDALVLDFPLYENIALGRASRLRGIVRWRALEEETVMRMEELDVRGAGPQAPARELSGGNQQKLVLARELGGGASALVAENPTRGLDARATMEVHRRLRAAAASGVAVVLYSSDLEEVVTLADRVLVLYGGRCREAPPDAAIVGRMMVGEDTAGAAGSASAAR